MLKKACLAAFLCAIFGFGFCMASEVNLPKNAKIGKTLEGKKLQEVLQKVKDSKKATIDKNKNEIQVRTILSVNNFTFDPNTDILVEVADVNDQFLYYLAAKKDKQAFCFDVKGTEKAPVEWVKPKAGIEEWNAIKNAYNGIFKADNTGGARVATNSAGMWIYATSYKDFANATIFSRNYSGNGPIRTDYFHAVINADGTLQITSALTDYSVDRVYTTRPYPLNEWVYIQAFQQANLYTIGWKTATDEEQKSKTFSRQTDLEGKDLNNIFSGLTGVTKTCVPIREFFYQPGIYMFELMNNYNSKAKVMEQAIQNVFGLDTELVDSINAAIMGQKSYLSIDNFDIYIDNNGVIYVIDIRNTSIGL